MLKYSRGIVAVASLALVVWFSSSAHSRQYSDCPGGYRWVLDDVLSSDSDPARRLEFPSGFDGALATPRWSVDLGFHGRFVVTQAPQTHASVPDYSWESVPASDSSSFAELQEVCAAVDTDDSMTAATNKVGPGMAWAGGAVVGCTGGRCGAYTANYCLHPEDGADASFFALAIDVDLSQHENSVLRLAAHESGGIAIGKYVLGR